MSNGEDNSGTTGTNTSNTYTDSINGIEKNSHASESSSDPKKDDSSSQQVVWPKLREFYNQQFNTYEGDSGKLSFECLSCRQKLKYFSASVTSNSNLRSHKGMFYISTSILAFI